MRKRKYVVLDASLAQVQQSCKRLKELALDHDSIVPACHRVQLDMQRLTVIENAAWVKLHSTDLEAVRSAQSAAIIGVHGVRAKEVFDFK